jgi:hypothetical protein
MASGAVISKFKPRPRYLAAWNLIVETMDVIGHFSYGFLGCAVDDLHGDMKPDLRSVMLIVKEPVIFSRCLLMGCLPC